MNPTIYRKMLWCGALILILCAGTAGAQDGADVMRSQQQPSPPPSIQPNPSQSTLELPTGPSNPVLEIPGQAPEPALSVTLPSPFVGCWEGTINGFDSLTPIGFLSSFIGGARITYRFCYLPNPDGKTYRMELRKLVIDNKELTATGFDNQVVWVDDHHGAGYLRNHLTVDQTSWLLFIPIRVREDIYAEEIVALDNPNLANMHGAELMKLNGSDYARISFHADFNRIPDALGAEPPSATAGSPPQSDTGASPFP